MKRILVVACLAFLLLGCSAATQSEFWQHDVVYQNWDHLKFSWYGYNKPTVEDSQMTVEQGWWGADVPYVPAQ